MRHRKPTATCRELEEARLEAAKWRREAEAVRELMRHKVLSLERTRDALVAAMAHRARSDLAAVIALIELKAMGSGEPAMRDVLLATAQRVRTMLQVHAQARLQPQGGRLGVDSRALLEGLGQELQKAVGRSARVELEVKADRHLLSLELATSLGLIANELVSNALEHAFPSARKQGDGAVRPDPPRVPARGRR